MALRLRDYHQIWTAFGTFGSLMTVSTVEEFLCTAFRQHLVLRGLNDLRKYPVSKLPPQPDSTISIMQATNMIPNVKFATLINTCWTCLTLCQVFAGSASWTSKNIWCRGGKINIEWCTRQYLAGVCSMCTCSEHRNLKVSCCVTVYICFCPRFPPCSNHVFLPWYRLICKWSVSRVGV